MLPKVIASNGNVEYANFAAVITVGEEDAAKLSVKLGRKVEVGEQFDIGTIATYNRNHSNLRNWLNNFRLSLTHRRGVFS